MLSLKRKSKTVASTHFSDFIRNASSAEKKRVYKRVLEKASESQNQVLTKITSTPSTKFFRIPCRRLPLPSGEGRGEGAYIAVKYTLILGNCSRRCPTSGIHAVVSFSVRFMPPRRGRREKGPSVRYRW